MRRRVCSAGVAHQEGPVAGWAIGWARYEVDDVSSHKSGRGRPGGKEGDEMTRRHGGRADVAMHHGTVLRYVLRARARILAEGLALAPARRMMATEGRAREGVGGSTGDVASGADRKTRRRTIEGQSGGRKETSSRAMWRGVGWAGRVGSRGTHSRLPRSGRRGGGRHRALQRQDRHVSGEVLGEPVARRPSRTMDDLESRSARVDTYLIISHASCMDARTTQPCRCRIRPGGAILGDRALAVEG